MTEPMLLCEILPRAMTNIRNQGNLRQQVMERDGGICQRCGKTAIIACHKNYDDKDFEAPEDLISLCEDCHDKHNLKFPDIPPDINEN